MTDEQKKDIDVVIDPEHETIEIDGWGQKIKVVILSKVFWKWFIPALVVAGVGLWVYSQM